MIFKYHRPHKNKISYLFLKASVCQINMADYEIFIFNFKVYFFKIFPFTGYFQNNLKNRVVKIEI